MALEAAAGEGPAALVGVPTLFLDVPLSCGLEARLVVALAAKASSCLAACHRGDGTSLQYWEQGLGGMAEELPVADSTKLGRLQSYLFREMEGKPEAEEPATQPSVGSLFTPQEVQVFSAPGESRECVEIARRIHQEAQRGVALDRMAVLLRSGTLYRAPVLEAMRRASLPAWFARGTEHPDPAGRALLALLACKAEGFSARRFAEYLSLGEVPPATRAGSPPGARSRAERFVPSEDELLVRGAGDLVEPSLANTGGEPKGRGVAAAGKVSSGAEPTATAAAAKRAVDPDDEQEVGVLEGNLRAPRRWEELLVEASVIGGLDRWRRRLKGLASECDRQLREVDSEDPRHAYLQRKRRHLQHLSRFALPMLEEMSEWPEQASWGEWCERLGALATRALRHPSRVLSVLAELEPLGEIGPVSLEEVKLVLARWLTDLTLPPQQRRFGRVFVGPIEAARGLSFDVVFVPGLAERVFPQKVIEDPMLLDAERQAFPDLVRNEQRVEAERAALQLAVGCAAERVVLSYSRLDVDLARPRVPSFYGLEVLRAAERRLPGFDELSRRAEQAGAARSSWPAPQDPTRAIDEAELDLALLGEVLRRPEQQAVGTARYLLQANPHLARALRSRARRWTLRKFTPADGLVEPRAEALEALQPHQLEARSYSPTTLEHFAYCPYRFLLKAVHRLQPRDEPVALEQIDPLTRGSLVHEVQYELLTELKDNGQLPVTAASLDHAFARLDALLDQLAASYADDLAPAIDRVWSDGVEAIRADLREWLRRVSEMPEWLPSSFELAFGLSGKAAEHRGEHHDAVPLDCGITLRGAIDLIERSAEGGSLRVTDYKTGRVRMSEGAVIEGGKMLQPVLYALVAEKLHPDLQVEAGRLYYCTSTGNYAERIVPLDDSARLAASEVARVLGGRLQEGNFPAAPAEGACRWCDYLAVCGPAEEIRTRRIKRNKSLGDVEHLRRLS
jgi:RecB family exonuclease